MGPLFTRNSSRFMVVQAPKKKKRDIVDNLEREKTNNKKKEFQDACDTNRKSRVWNII